MGESKSVLDYGRYFGKKLPGAWALIVLLLLFSALLSIASSAVVHGLDYGFLDIVLVGLTVCLFAVVTPTLLTTIFIKMATRNMRIKHILFMSFIGGLAFAIFIFASSMLYRFFGAAVAAVAVVVGAASIFGWWFFTEKIIAASTHKGALLALIQPTLFLLFFIASSGFLFSSGTPTNMLLIKLYAGIFVFGIVIYAIILFFNRPVKKALGFNAFDFFSAIIQEWLFGISAYKPFTFNYGTPYDIPVQAVTFGKKNEKAVFVVPMLHYGVMGNIGGSSFPSLLEKYGNQKYRLATFVMHTAVNEDFNPASAWQLPRLKGALDQLLRSAKPAPSSMSYSEGRCGASKAVELSFGNVSIVSFTRAPRVTEDISPEAAVLFRHMLAGRCKNIVLLDAHNSRYESAPAEELEGIRFNSRYMEEYVGAIKRLKRLHHSKRAEIGFASTDIYGHLHGNRDIARGNLNVALFRFNSFTYAMLLFNANNMKPSLRSEIVSHARRAYGIEAEVFTTDTHAVNSISLNASNVLGRETRFSEIREAINSCMETALAAIQECPVGYSETLIKKFMIWGRNSRERMLAVLGTVSVIAKVIIPILIAAGFLLAAWVVSVI